MELIFIYNAGSSVFEVASDFAHKIFSPKTYNCDLCSLTHGNFGEKKEWKAFIASLEIPVNFYHKDTWEETSDDKSTRCPIVLLKDKDGIKELLDSNEISKQGNIGDLILALKKALPKQ
jgi:hypothetical protein